jgi:hypothetical protein
MSARRISPRSDRQAVAGENSFARLLGAGETPAVLLSGESGTEDVSALEDSEKFSDDLVRRFEAAYPLPWRHGGLNE